MVRLYRCDRETSEELRNRQINEIRAELAAAELAKSELPTLGSVSVAINTRKIRNRSQTDLTDRYIITAHIIV